MLEVTVKDLTKSKLTVTPTRQLLKVATGGTLDEALRLRGFSESIVSELMPTLTHSLRGQFFFSPDGKYFITLEDNSRKEHLTFVEK